MDAAVVFFASAEFVALVMFFLGLEAAGLYAWDRRHHPQQRHRRLCANLAGLCLLLALYFSLANANPLWIVVALAGALVSHTAELILQAPSGNTITARSH